MKCKCKGIDYTKGVSNMFRKRDHILCPTSQTKFLHTPTRIAKPFFKILKVLYICFLRSHKHSRMSSASHQEDRGSNPSKVQFVH